MTVLFVLVVTSRWSAAMLVPAAISGVVIIIRGVTRPDDLTSVAVTRRPCATAQWTPAVGLSVPPALVGELLHRLRHGVAGRVTTGMQMPVPEILEPEPDGADAAYSAVAVTYVYLVS